MGRTELRPDRRRDRSADGHRSVPDQPRPAAAAKAACRPQPVDHFLRRTSVNELEILASLRDEVPVEASPRIEHAVMTAIQTRPALAGTRKQPARGVRLRPALAGAIAVAIGAGTFAGVELWRSPAASHEAVAWSGRPTAAWPVSQPSYGRARTEAQLIDYVTRAAAAAPGRAPKPDEWVAVKVEYADSSKGSGGYIFGPPDERKISLVWYRGDQCAIASVPDVPANLPPAKTVNGKL